MVILYEVFGKSEILKKFLCEKEVLFFDRVMFFYLIVNFIYEKYIFFILVKWVNFNINISLRIYVLVIYFK